MPLVKPHTPVAQEAFRPPGCKLYAPLTEGAGAIARNHFGKPNGTLISSLIWQVGEYGPQLTGFGPPTSSTTYVTFDQPILLGPVYPFWMAGMVVNTVSAIGWIGSQGWSGGANPLIGLRLNTGTTGWSYFLRGDDNVSATVDSAAINTNDGRPHVLMGCSLSATNHRLYADGKLIASGSATLGTIAVADRLTMGVLRRATSTQAFPGAILWFGCGNRAVPGPMALATDLLSGRFSAIRTPAFPAMYRAGALADLADVEAPLFRRTIALRTGSRGAA